jgi:putative oxidoreductase
MLKYLMCENGKCADKAWPDAAFLVLRLVLGTVFIIHGYDKLFGEFGVAGFAGFLTKLNVPLPLFFAWLVSLVEFLGGIGVFLGTFTRPLAALIAIDMVVAFYLTKKGLPKGDLDFALFGIATALALGGSGRYALWRSKCCRESITKM